MAKNIRTKYIFITGGVLSGLGKGITSASIGNILKARGFSINLQKCDPYLNVDAGTLNPGEHGEVFVTDDGAETDMDVGHYERFIDTNLTSKSSLMSGYVYHNILSAERKGEYLGKTVQIIPHVIREIQRLIINAAQGHDIHIVEIGGTVGDYEALHFLEAIRQIKRRVGPENVLYGHLVFLPYLATSDELKTKPAQNSIRDLRELGIHPDIILCRSDHSINQSLIEKISVFCDVDIAAIVPLPTARSVYEVPLMLEAYGTGDYIVKKLKLPKRRMALGDWVNFTEKIKQPKKKVTIGLVAKYLTNKDTYMSITEALKIAAWHKDYELEIEWIDSEKIEKSSKFSADGLDGILIPGGFGNRGIEGKIIAARFARENKIPYLGICLGMQVMVIEFARKILGFNNANSTEFDSETEHPVIDIMADQKNIQDKGGTMRLGAYPCILSKDSQCYNIYRAVKISERHRHRFEFNNKYREIFAKYRLRIAGISPDKRLVEIVEVCDHPFMVGVQFHPEFKSRPLTSHPLFDSFIEACLTTRRAREIGARKTRKITTLKTLETNRSRKIEQKIGE